MLRSLIVPMVVVALVGIAGTSNAQMRDAGAKIRGEFGDSSRQSGQFSQSRSYEYSAAPLARQSDAGQDSSSDGRRFSYEPANAADDGCGCPSHGASAARQAPPTTAAVPDSGRRFSYEPENSGYSGSRPYSARSTRSDDSGSNWALPKTDPRKFRVR